MLNAPRSAGANLCLRCQLRIWARTVPPPTFHKSLNATFTTSSRRSDDTHIKTQDLQGSRDGPAGGSTNKSWKHIYPHGRVRGPKGKKVIESSAQLDIKSLGEASDIILLRDAQFEKENEPPKEEKPKQQTENPVSISTQDILKSINDQKRDPTEREVYNDLEKLRQTLIARSSNWPGSLSSSELDDLIKTLADRFQKAQLHAYAKNLVANKSDAPLYRYASSHAAKIIKSHWRPVQHTQTPLSQRLEGLSSVSLDESSITKTELINILVQYIWEFQDDEGLGEMELELKPELLDLLTAGDAPSVLQQVATAQDVHMLPVRSDNVIRIVAPHGAAYRATKEIEARLSTVVTKTVDLTLHRVWIQRQVIGKFLAEDDLRHLAGQSRIAIIPYKSGTHPVHKLTISGFDATEVEDTYTILLARMCLPAAAEKTLLRDPSGPRLPMPLVCSPVDLKHSPPSIQTAPFVRHVVDDVGDHKRTMTLSRASPWTMASSGAFPSFAEWKSQRALNGSQTKLLHEIAELISPFKELWDSVYLMFKDSNPNVTQVQQAARHALRKTLDQQDSWHNPEISQDKLVSFWDGGVDTMFSAHYGSILQVMNTHNIQIEGPLFRAGPSTISKALGKKAGRYYFPAKHVTRFEHSTPYSFRLLSHLQRVCQANEEEPQNPSPTTKNELLFRFTPSPLFEFDTGQRDRKILGPFSRHKFPPEMHPHVEVCFASQSDSDPTPRFRSLRALVCRGISEIALPHAPTDLRLQQQTYIYSTASAIAGDPETASLIASIEECIGAGGVLRAPSSVSLPVPVLTGPWSASNPARKRFAVWSSFPKRVPYFFVGVEHRQSTSIPLPRSPARIEVTAVEGGRARGRTTEVKLVHPSSEVDGEKPFMYQPVPKWWAPGKGTRTLEQSLSLAYLLHRAAVGKLPDVEETLELLKGATRAGRATPEEKRGAGFGHSGAEREDQRVKDLSERFRKLPKWKQKVSAKMDRARPMRAKSRETASKSKSSRKGPQRVAEGHRPGASR